jgi:uncharacterized protein (TIGR03437 family)
MIDAETRAIFPAGSSRVFPYGVLTGSDPSSIALPVKVAVGGKEAKVTYAGSAPGLVVGVSQITFQIPSGLELGAAGVVVSAGEFISAAVVTIAVK